MIDDQVPVILFTRPRRFGKTLALDMLQFMNDCLPFEVVRDYEFAPIKNAEGVDSPETARALLKKNGYKL